MSDINAFRIELRRLLNHHGWDAKTNNPDFIIADILIDVLESLGRAEARKWNLSGGADIPVEGAQPMAEWAGDGI